jgi:hypothetical protein
MWTTVGPTTVVIQPYINGGIGMVAGGVQSADPYDLRAFPLFSV